MGGVKQNGSKAKPPPGVYQDEPDRDDAASMSSAISLRENIGLLDEDEPELPPYSENPSSVPEESIYDNVPQPSQDLDPEVESWTHEDAKGSNYTRLSQTLSADPVALKAYIEYQSSVNPAAYIKIHGMHTETHGTGNNKKKEKKIDFDIKLDVTDTISRRSARLGRISNVPEWSSLRIIDNDRKTFRGTRLKTVNKQFRADIENTREAASLEEHCHLFCASGSKLKSYLYPSLFLEVATDSPDSFTLRHHIINRNDAILTEHVTRTIRSTGYRGHITITFPLYPRTLTIATPHTLNRLRHNKLVYWTCIILQLWLLTWPILFLLTKRWSMTETYWPYKIPDGEPREGIDNEGRRIFQQHFKYVKESERVWAERYRYTIQKAVLSRAQGGAIVGFVQNGREAEDAERQRLEREREPQGGFVGGALALARGLGNVARELDAGREWGYDT